MPTENKNTTSKQLTYFSFRVLPTIYSIYGGNEKHYELEIRTNNATVRQSFVELPDMFESEIEFLTRKALAQLQTMLKEKIDE